MKQTIGRGTRINEDYGKYYFTIIDFKKATELFAEYPEVGEDQGWTGAAEPGPDEKGFGVPTCSPGEAGREATA